MVKYKKYLLNQKTDLRKIKTLAVLSKAYLSKIMIQNNSVNPDHLNLKPRNKKQIKAILFYVLKNFINPRRELICEHMFIGSSQFYQFYNSSLKFSQIHPREYYKGARSDGEIFEEHFKNFHHKILMEKNLKLINITDSQVFKRSNIYPFLTATPDFIGFFSRNKKKEKVLVEIKSTQNLEKFNNLLSEGYKKNKPIYQVQCSLNIHLIEIAYLVVYFYKKKKDKKIQKKNAENSKIGIRIIKRDKDFFKNKTKIISCYKNFLVSFFKHSFKTDLDKRMEDYIEYNLKCFINKKEKILQNKKKHICLYLQNMSLQELISKRSIKKLKNEKFQKSKKIRTMRNLIINED